MRGRGWGLGVRGWVGESAESGDAANVPGSFGVRRASAAFIAAVHPERSRGGGGKGRETRSSPKNLPSAVVLSRVAYHLSDRSQHPRRHVPQRHQVSLGRGLPLLPRYSQLFGELTGRIPQHGCHL